MVFWLKNLLSFLAYASRWKGAFFGSKKTHFKQKHIVIQMIFAFLNFNKNHVVTTQIQHDMDTYDMDT